MPDPKISLAIRKLQLKVKHIYPVPESNSSLVRILEMEKGNKMVLKIHWNRQKMEREIHALQQLAPHQQFPEIIDSYQDDEGRALLIEFLPGTVLSSHRELTPQMAHQLGQAMACIHQIGMKHFDGRSSWRQLLREKVEEYRILCTDRIALPDLQKGIDTLHQKLHLVPECRQPVLVHFDLRLGNVLAADRTITGIIDFESARGGSGDMDFYKIWQEVWVHSPELQAATLDGYRSVSPTKTDLQLVLPLYGLYHSIAGITWCLKMNRVGSQFYLQNVEKLQHFRQAIEET